jgi:lipoprotein NlpI
VLRLAIRRDGALDDAKAVLDIEGWRGDPSRYAVLWGYFAALRDGHKDQARSLIDEAAAKCDPKVWPNPVVRHLRGELDEAGLLAFAEDEDQRGEAHFYLGLEAVEDGRSDAGLEHLRRVKAWGKRRFSESIIGIPELDRLLAKGAEGDGP